MSHSTVSGNRIARIFRFSLATVIVATNIIIMASFVGSALAENEGEEAGTAIFETDLWYFQDKNLLNDQVSSQNDDDAIELALWGNNLPDEERASNPAGFAADEFGRVWTTIDDPRTYGVDLRYSF